MKPSHVDSMFIREIRHGKWKSLLRLTNRFSTEAEFL